jgi:hypothetical protein
VVADQHRAALSARVEAAVEIARPDIVPVGLGVAKQAEQLGQVRSSFMRRVAHICIVGAPENTGCEPL